MASHIEDSLQLMVLIPITTDRMVDLGSGAGLPGVVIAIARPAIIVHLVEKDQRKIAFLQEVVSQLNLKNIILHNIDIATLNDKFPIITARALAPLELLCLWSYPLLEKNSVCLFPKGKNTANELEACEKNWNFTHRLIPSSTQAGSSIVSLTELSIKG